MAERVEGKDSKSPGKLPPMGALEFAIAQALRNYFFALRLLLAWALVIPPPAALYFILALGGKVPDAAAMPPAELGAAAVLAAIALLVLVSMTVNWYRRILLGETPRGLLWWRLDRPVWRYLAASLLLSAILAAFGLAAAAAILELKPAFETAWGPQAGQGAIAMSVVLTLLAVITGFRLAAWPPAMAVAESGFGVARARRATKRNAFRFIAHLFWLAFALAIAGAAAAGGLAAAQALVNPWATAGAIALSTVLAWFALLVLLSIPASLYRHFGEGKPLSGPHPE